MKTFFGRRFSRDSKKNNVNLLLSSSSFFDSLNGKSKIEDFSKKYNTLNLEIGFGNGENLIYQAQKNPHQGFVGCDPFLSGSIKVLEKISSYSIKNILVSDMDFSKFLVTNISIKYNNIFTLFPDPWPKKRHKKRRLVNYKFINEIAKLIKLNGKAFLKTDSEDYFKSIVSDFIRNNRFSMLRTFDSNFEIEPYAKTKYSQKASDNQRVIFSSVFELNK